MMRQMVRLLFGSLISIPVAIWAQEVPLLQDTYIVPGSGVNFGGATTLSVGGPTGSRGLIQFDLSTLPAGTVGGKVMKATLTVFVSKVGAPGSLDFSVANGSWTESAVSGLNAPVPGATVQNAVTVTASGVWLAV